MDDVTRMLGNEDLFHGRGIADISLLIVVEGKDGDGKEVRGRDEDLFDG